MHQQKIRKPIPFPLGDGKQAEVVDILKRSNRRNVVKGHFWV